jgi:hypothetical protein
MAAALSTASDKSVAGTMPSPLRPARDKILGYGAAVGAMLSVIGLNISSLLLVIGLAYVAAAFLTSPDRRDTRLRLAAWVFAVIGLMATAAFSTLLGSGYDGLIQGESSLFTYLPLGRATVVLGAAGVAALSLAAILAALAVGKDRSRRYHRLGQSALCVAFYFISTLPATVAEAPAPAALGSFWTAPLDFLYATMGIVGAAAIACSFLWANIAEHNAGTGSPGLFRYAQREYLLLVGAVSLLLPRLTGLALFEWSSLRRTARETVGEAALKAASGVSWLLLLIVLSAAAAVGFWVSCRQAGWKPGDWVARPAAPARDAALAGAGVTSMGATGAAPTAGAVEPQSPHPQQRLPLLWAQRLFLSWRLPLLYGWLLVLVAACSFLGWYGFLAAVPAAVHYVWMLTRER